MNLNLDLEHQIGNLSVPEIDIHDRVMHKISSNKQKSFTLNTKVLIASIISLLVIVGTGFASAHFIILYNDKGEELLSIQPLVPSNSNKESEGYMNFIDYGEAMALYSPDDNGNWSVSTIVKPFLFDDWNTFLDAINHTIPIAPSFNAEYKFNQGRITYKAISSDNNSLIEESQEKGNIVTYKKLELSGTIGLISLIFEKDNYEYTVRMSQAEQWHTIYVDALNHANHTSKFKLDDSEGFISIADDETYAMWRSSEELGSILYQISSTNTTSKVDEEIKAIILSLLQK